VLKKKSCDELQIVTAGFSFERGLNIFMPMAELQE
jgi:hypothetical protein